MKRFTCTHKLLRMLEFLSNFLRHLYSLAFILSGDIVTCLLYFVCVGAFPDIVKHFGQPWLFFKCAI